MKSGVPTSLARRFRAGIDRIHLTPGALRLTPPTRGRRIPQATRQQSIPATPGTAHRTQHQRHGNEWSDTDHVDHVEGSRTSQAHSSNENWRTGFRFWWKIHRLFEGDAWSSNHICRNYEQSCLMLLVARAQQIHKQPYCSRHSCRQLAKERITRVNIRSLSILRPYKAALLIVFSRVVTGQQWLK